MKPMILNDRLQKAVENLYLFFAGGVLYFGLEVLARGWSHISMALCGGLALVFIFRFRERFPHLSLPGRAFFGSLFITLIELVSGCIVNLWLGLHIWDYSAMPYQLLGQICLPFSVLWFFLSIAADLFCGAIRRFVFPLYE